MVKSENKLTKNRAWIAAVVAGVLLALGGAVQAEGVTTKGDVAYFETVFTGLDLREGRLESNTKIFGFAEAVEHTLGRDLAVDVVDITPGMIDRTNDLSPGYIEAGTEVYSYYFHFDPTPSGLLGLFSDGYQVEGRIHFPHEILGIQVLRRTLNGGHNELGLDNVRYSRTSTVEFRPRGMEWIDIVNDGTIDVSMMAFGGVDDFRVITSTMPVPGGPAAVLPLVGALAVAVRGARRRWGL